MKTIPSTGLGRRIMEIIRRRGELPTMVIVNAMTSGVGRKPSKADVERELCDLVQTGLLDVERRPATIYHQGDPGRLWTYWRERGT